MAFKRLRKLALSIMVPVLLAAMPSASVTASEYTDGAYYFRYRTGSDVIKAANPYDAKYIVAFYVGGVGMPFSEKLPIKPQWQNVNWTIVDPAKMPAGITFNKTTRIFSGTPSLAGRNQVIEMIGYDAEGNPETTAQVTFDIFDVSGEPFSVDLYAHTGKFKSDTLPSPKNATVDTWFHVFPAPQGITVTGPYFEGIPTKAAVYPVFMQGLDYLGNVVATYYGKYTVEDGPTFDVIPDDIRTLAPAGKKDWQYSGKFAFGAPSTYAVQHAIDPTKAVRYYLRIDSIDGLPGNIKSNSKPDDLRLEGFVLQPYDTGTAHFHAVDSDGTTGDSNTFTFGTGDPTPVCKYYPNAPTKITFVTGTTAATQLTPPFGAQGALRYTITAGTLPEGLSLEDGGRVVGVAKFASPQTPLTVQVDVVNGENTATAGECNYNIQVVNQKLKLWDSSPAQNQHGRVGAPYSGEMSVSGGIPDFTVDWTAGVAHPMLSAAMPSKNRTTTPVTGFFEKQGLPFSYNMTLVNGDTNVTTGDLDLYGHAPLAFGANRTFVPNFTVTRLGQSANWGAIPYDKDTVIPDTSGSVDQPVLTIDPLGNLPQGIGFDGRRFTGMTVNAEGQYGPFEVLMADHSGESILSEPFYLTVAHRDEIVINSVPQPVFSVETAAPQQGPFPIYTQPPGAAAFKLTWTLNGPALPDWARFDRSTGTFSADPNIAYSELLQPANETLYGPYTLTVSDDDPLTPSTSAATAPFYVKLTDLPKPSAKIFPQVLGTVSGDADISMFARAKAAVIQAARPKTVTTLKIDKLRDYIDATTIVGTVDKVTFLGSDPSAPAGLPLQISDDGHTAWFEGSPTEAYKGMVEVSFKDIRGRVGAIKIPMDVKGYPVAAMTKDSYDLPRLAPAADYGLAAQPCVECWNDPTWQIDPTGAPLPGGLTLDPTTGQIMGSTTEIDDETPDTRSPFDGIVLKATSLGANGETLVAWTDSFSINVKPRVEMTLAYPSGPDVFYLNDVTASSGYSFNDRNVSVPKVGGSTNPAVTFDIQDQTALLSDQGLNTTSGLFTWNNGLTLGEWTPEVVATDADGQQARSPLTVKATLAGLVNRTAGIGRIKLRVSEAFATGVGHRAYLEPIQVIHVVGDMTYKLGSAPSTVNMIATSGTFLDDSRFDNPGSYTLTITGKDADDRVMDVPAAYQIEVVPPLTFIDPAETTFTGRQYDPDSPVSATFSDVQDKLDIIRYTVEAAPGSEIPGLIVYKVYDPESGVFTYWEWMDADNRSHLVVANDPQWKDKLPPDALVFDPADRSLRGIPSKAGTFSLYLVARDDHMKSYLHTDDIHPVERREETNTASLPFKLVVDPAYPMTIENRIAAGPADAEALSQYTSVPTMRSVVTKAAYGRPLTWVKTAGALPQNVTAGPSGTSLAYAGYPEVQGTFPGIVYKGTDRAGRDIMTDAVSFTVGDRQKFELVATENPRRMAVNLTDANLTVAPKFAAYGKAPGKANWTVTGVSNLPPGVTSRILDGSVRFEGIATVIGIYKPVTITGRDALGASSTITLEFNVRIPDGAIVLNVNDLITKPGYPFQLQATHGNTYGDVRYYSYDISGTYKNDVTINEDTGLVEGKFATPQKVDFDIYVTDETHRITSRPVTLEVIPFVRPTVPQTVKATETKPMSQEIATDYVLGTVTYQKGNGNWPVGIDVDSATGKIHGTSISEPGNFTGLTIIATDVFQDFAKNTYTDQKHSNTFDFALDGIPDISDVASNSVNRLMSFEQDLPITPWTPTVIDSITKKTWNLPGTTFSINKDIEFDTGLSFDTKTGTLSGTPTKLALYTDLTVTVTSPFGSSDTTAPFWFAVQPQGSIWAKVIQKDDYHERVGTLFSTEAPLFENTVGSVSYTQTGMPTGLVFNSFTGVVSGTPTKAGISSISITAKDGAGRQAKFVYELNVKGALDMTLAKPVLAFNIGQTYPATNMPTITALGDVATYEATGLPDGLTLNSSDGSISGTPSDIYANGAEFPVTIKLRDSFDAQTREVSYTITLARPILPQFGQKTDYKLRTGSATTTLAPMFTNAVGAATYKAAPLPEGLSVDVSTGAIAGTPILSVNSIGVTTPSVVTITDSAGRTGTLAINIHVMNPLSMVLPSPTTAIDPDIAVTSLNKPTTTNVGGTATYTAEGLPAGMTLDATDGSLSGTISSGDYVAGTKLPVKITVTDDYDGSFQEVSYVLTVSSKEIGIEANQKTLYRARTGAVITTDAPRFKNTFGAVSYTQTGKPSWLTFNPATGVMSGTATTAWTGTITITVKDSIGRTFQFPYTVSTKAALGLTLTPTTNGFDFDQTLAAVNKPTAVNIGDIGTFTAPNLPAGLTIDPSTGAVSGTLASGSHTAGTVFSIKVKLTDSFDNDFREVNYVLTVGDKIVARANQKTEYVGRVADAFTTEAPLFDNAIGSVTFTQAGKPAALAINASTGIVSGKLATATVNIITITVRDSVGRTATFAQTMTVKPALTMTLANPVIGLDLDRTYADFNRPTVATIGKTASFTAVGLPAGLQLNAATGAISGTLPSSVYPVGSTFSVKVTVTDDFDNLTKEVDYVLTAGTPMAASSGQKTAYLGRTGTVFTSVAPTFDNALGTMVYTASGVPSGLSVNSSTGVVSGTIGSPSNSTITITAKDGVGRTAVFAYTLTTKGKLVVTLAEPTTEIRQSTGQIYTEINRPVTTSVGGTLSYAQVGLPQEFTLDAANGSISGSIPRGTYPDGTTFLVTITATDSFDGDTREITYALVASDAPAPTVDFNFGETGYIATLAQTITPVYGNAKIGDVLSLAPGSAPLPPGFSLVKRGTGIWILVKAATTDADIGAYEGIRFRVTDVDGQYSDSAAKDILLRDLYLLTYPAITVSNRVNVPLTTSAPTASFGVPIKDVSFAFSTDTTGGKLTIDGATGMMQGYFTANGTNVVTVTESYSGKTIRTFTYNVPLKVLPLTVTMPDVSGLPGHPLANWKPVIDNPIPAGRWSLIGDVPSWLSIDPLSGALRGTPDAAEASFPTIVYTDSYASATATFKVGISGGTKGYKFLKIVDLTKNQYLRDRIATLRLFDEYGIDAASLATIVSETQSFALALDSDDGTWADLHQKTDRTFVLSFPQKIDFTKVTYLGGMYYFTGWGGLSSTTLTLEIHGSDDGANFTLIGSGTGTIALTQRP